MKYYFLWKIINHNLPLYIPCCMTHLLQERTPLEPSTVQRYDAIVATVVVLVCPPLLPSETPSRHSWFIDLVSTQRWLGLVRTVIISFVNMSSGNRVNLEATNLWMNVVNWLNILSLVVTYRHYDPHISGVGGRFCLINWSALYSALQYT